MSLPVEIPQAQTAFIDADGKLTVEAHLMLVKMAEALREAQTRLDALEAP